ncbi:hypothetical protein [Microbacterium oxydans]|uniref:hypothetical protein n=1 Tax=Microbacterium oxydans TaxID=82380 RepID=UPI0024ADDBF3|nr:hypothetical protein [Microbacterium oxydans]
MTDFWGTLNWGTVPDWLVAAGTIGATWTALALSYRARAEQKLQLVADVAIGDAHQDLTTEYSVFTLTIDNRSAYPLREITGYVKYFKDGRWREQTKTVRQGAPLAPGAKDLYGEFFSTSAPDSVSRVVTFLDARGERRHYHVDQRKWLSEARFSKWRA